MENPYSDAEYARKRTKFLRDGTKREILIHWIEEYYILERKFFSEIESAVNNIQLEASFKTNYIKLSSVEYIYNLFLQYKYSIEIKVIEKSNIAFVNVNWSDPAQPHGSIIVNNDK